MKDFCNRKYIAADETAELIALNESIARMLPRWQATLTPPEQTRKQGKDRPRTKDQERTKDQGRTKT